MLQFGKAVKDMRKMLGISGDVLAAVVGIDRGNLSRYETGSMSATMQRARELSEAMDLPLFVVVAIAEEEDVRNKWPEWGMAMKEIKAGVSSRVAREHEQRGREVMRQGRTAPRFRRL